MKEINVCKPFLIVNFKPHFGNSFLEFNVQFDVLQIFHV
jgi:hypothetical protein